MDRGVMMTDGEFELEFTNEIAESYLAITTQDISEKLHLAKEEALKVIVGRCKAYRERGYDRKLVLAVLKKKLALLKDAKRAKDINKIKEPSAPGYTSSGFITDETWVAEEELIQWSLASLRAPLSQAGCERFLMLVKQFYGRIPQIEEL